MNDSPQYELSALQRLQKISTEMVSELELDRLLESIMRGAADLLTAYYAHLYRYDPEGDSLKSWIPLELPQGVLALDLERGEGAAGTVLATGRALRIDDYDSWEGRTDKWPSGATGPTLQVPVRHGHRFLAVLTVGRRPGDEPFGENDEQLFELFANQAAIAIANARLYRDAKRSGEEFAKLYETSLDIASELELEPVLEAILQRASDLLDARTANLRAYRPEKDMLVSILPYRQYGPLAELELAPGEGVSGRAFSSGEPLVIEEYDSWEGRSDKYPAGLFARVMAVPLKRGDKVTGVLTVDRTPEKAPFSDQDVRLLSLFANQAALAIANAELYTEAQQRGREFSHLYDTSLDITAKLELNQVLESVIRRTTDLVEAQQGEVVVYDDDTGIVTDFLSIGLSEVGLPADVHPSGQAPTGLDGVVIERRKPVRIEDYDRWPGRLPSSPIGLIGPMIGVPILHQDRILGSLSLARAGGERPYTDQDEQRLLLFANQAAVAIQNARQVDELRQLHEERLATERLNAQMETAKAVQSGLLPAHPPKLQNWDLAFRWRPALQIGGDFYDFIELDDSCWGVVVGDVADKGIPAAIFMSLALSMIRAESSGRKDPEAVFRLVNRSLVSGSHSGIFVTAAYGVLRSDGRAITVSSAGHNPVLIRKASSGAVEALDLPGTVLGVEDDSRLEHTEIELEPGDVALFYTDGVTEAMNEEGVPFGQDRLEALMASDLPKSADGICQVLVAAVADYTGVAEQSDDLTHIVIRAVD